MSRQLLIEEVPLDLIESKIDSKKGFYGISGPFIECNIENRNKRSYPDDVVRPQVEKYQQMISENRAVGELNHPDTLEINPKNIAIKTTSLKFDGDNIVLGEANVCSTPNGMIIRALMDDNIKLAVSTRGAGTLKEGVVQNDFVYVCQDVVWSPSAPSAFVDNILEAKTEWVIKNGILFEQEIENLQNRLKDFKGEDIATVVTNVFESALVMAMNKLDEEVDIQNLDTNNARRQFNRNLRK